MAPEYDPEVEGFFSTRDRVPGALLKEVGHQIGGEIVEQYARDYIPYAKTDPEIDERTGKPVRQLVVILQTKHSGWQNVNKVPTDKEGAALPVELDTGKRAVYLRPGTNIHAAVRDALKNAGEKHLKDGGMFGVKIVDTKDTGRGNPLKIHAAKYKAPEPEADFFGGSQPAQSAPPAAQAAPQPPSTPAADPWATTAPAAAQSDPWANTPQPAGVGAGAADPWGSDEPPF